MAIGRFKMDGFSLLGRDAGSGRDRHDRLHRDITWVPCFLFGLLLQSESLPSGLQRGRILADGFGSDRLAFPVCSDHPVLEEQPIFNPDKPGDLGNGLLPVTSLHPEGTAAISG